MSQVLDLRPRLERRRQAATTVNFTTIDFQRLEARYPEVLPPRYLEIKGRDFVLALVNRSRGTFYTFKNSGQLQAVQVVVLPGDFYGMKYYMGETGWAWERLHAMPQPVFRIEPGTYKQNFYADRVSQLADYPIHTLVVDPQRYLRPSDERI